METIRRSRAPNWWNPARWITAGIVSFLVMSWSKRLACIALAAVMLFGIASLGHSFKGWSLPSLSFGRLPPSAAERAPLFTQAWAAQDRARMMEFVAAADEPKLKAWIAANPVPASVANIPALQRKSKTISVQKDDTDGAIIKVRVSDGATSSDDPKAAGVYTQSQIWTFSGGHWFFSPETVPADAAPSQTVASNLPNSRSNVAGNAASNSRWQPSYPRAADMPPPAPVSRNVVIPSNVPPWARGR